MASTEEDLYKNIKKLCKQHFIICAAMWYSLTSVENCRKYVENLQTTIDVALSLFGLPRRIIVKLLISAEDLWGTWKKTWKQLYYDF